METQKRQECRCSYLVVIFCNTHLQELEPFPEPLRPAQVDAALPDRAEAEADGEEAALVEERHRGDRAKLHLQQPGHGGLEIIILNVAP